MHGPIELDLEEYLDVIEPYQSRLSSWEYDFIESMKEWEGEPTDAQREKLEEIYQQVITLHEPYAEALSRDD